MSSNYFWYGREWPYKNVKPRIIVEKYMCEETGKYYKDLPDYKIWCFSGVPKLTLVCSERFNEEGLKENFYDDEWNLIDLRRPNHDNSSYSMPMPKSYERMKEIALYISKNIAFSRIDFYEVDDQPYIGEITFYPSSGFEGFIPDEWDDIMGSWIYLDGA